MTQFGLMIDNEYCTGCHSCEVSCKNEHDLPLGQWGIKVLELGPWKLPDGKKWEYRYVPVLTSLCDLCSDRINKGEKPACVLHCLASCMEYGSMEELAQKMEAKGKKAMILVP
jgi:Fe-S-cluster-containing dehydrogenase component